MPADEAKAEFGVYNVTRDGGDLVVTGRSHSGTIRAGTVFTRVFRYEHTKVDGEFVDSRIVDERSTALVVKTVEFYRKFVSELDRGLSGQLRLGGGDLPDLRQDDVLAE